MGETAARRGTEKRQRGARVFVRCTDAELAAITAAAARAGMTVAAFLRHQAIGTVRPPCQPAVRQVRPHRACARPGGSRTLRLERQSTRPRSKSRTRYRRLRTSCSEAAAATLDMRAMLMRALGRGD